MIAIIDYGVGNLRSVQKALEKVGAQATFANTPEHIQSADKIVLPGVGAMGAAMEKLQDLNLVDVIKEGASTKPFLGICVGFQLLFETSEEGGGVEGLGILPGKVQQFTQGKVPQIGWNQIQIQQKDCPLFQNIEEGSNVYFCHSYYASPVDQDVTASTTEYGINYTSAVCKDNVMGVQFHPEKSQTVGLKILENFVKI